MTSTLTMMAAFATLCGLSAATFGYAAVRLATSAGGDARVRQRLRGIGGQGKSKQQELSQRLRELGLQLVRRVSSLVYDEKGEKKLALRRKLVSGGIYLPDAPRNFAVARYALLVLGLGGGFLLATSNGGDPWIYAGAAGGVGYFLPVLWLGTKVKKNKKALESGLPDALDLMVVCVEAGLTIDAAMQRVGEELALAHPVLARELSVCHMETQIGLPRQQAMRNLGERTDYAPLKALTAMLVQADRFGTSIAMALRIQAEAMRQKRQHKSEEAAAKASVKLTFPLVLFIFPASFIVLAGPVVLKMMNSSLFQ